MLTVPGVQKLVDFANEGLPIVVSGGLPQNLTGYNISGTEYVRSALAGIVSLRNVHVVPYDNLAASLSALGIKPRTAVSADRTWYTYVREDDDASVTYVYVYNDAWDSELGEGASTGSITFEIMGVPYAYDAFTGDTTAILGYEQSSTTTTISLSLAGNQSTIIGFHHDESTTNTTRVLSVPVEVYRSQHESNYGSSAISLNVGNASAPILLSNGTAVYTPTPAAPIDLSNWTLIIESWSSPSDPYTEQTQAAKSNSTYQLDSLKPWNQISDSLQNVSGRGFYSTTFSWPPENGTANGAVLSLGAIVHTARAWVNGHQLPPLDPTNAVADIGNCLSSGVNTVEIEVSTTLGNALRPVYETVRSSGTTWLGPQPVEQDYGLVQPVTVLPYNTVTIDL